MNQEEYYRYLKKLIRDDSPDEWDETNTFGLFQRFRPDGEGLEAVFEPIPHGERLLARLRPVYAATNGPESMNDAYFVVRSPQPWQPAEVEPIAHAFLDNLRHLARTIDDPELSDLLAATRSVRFEDIESEAYESDEHLCVYETVGDWLIEVTDYSDLVPALKEAYYSVACDPWLSDYLRWPYYERFCPRDVFAPYFELWRRGLRFAFDQGSLILGRDA